MSSEGGLHGDLRCLSVANLANEDNVGVLSQNCAQSVGKCCASQSVDLNLVDVGKLVLDRILDRRDVAGFAVQLVERRIQRRGLTCPGRTTNDQQSVR